MGLRCCITAIINCEFIKNSVNKSKAAWGVVKSELSLQKNVNVTFEENLF